MHQPLPNTVSWSRSRSLQNDIVQQNQLRTILSQYPEVMFFSGHTQLQLGLEHDIVKDQFTMVNDSSVGMLVDGNNKSVPNDSEGLLVTVYKNKGNYLGTQNSQCKKGCNAPHALGNLCYKSNG